MYQGLIETIEEKIASRSKDPFIIAIDGRCASGKTTLSKEMESYFDCNIFHLDDFFLRSEQRTQERLSTPGENVDHERFVSEVLLPLKENIPFSYRPFSCSSMTLSRPISINTKPVAIIEGSYSMHPDIRRYCLLTIFLSISKEKQIDRLRIREGEEKLKMFKSKWIPLEEMYIKAFSPDKLADIQINVDDYQNIIS